MNKLTNLKLLKNLLDGVLRVEWEHYLKLKENLSFQHFKKRQLIRSAGIKERYCYLVMKGMAGITLKGKLEKVFPEGSLCMDRASGAMESPSIYAIEAMEDSLVVFWEKDWEKVIMEKVPVFKEMSKRLYRDFQDLDRFYEHLQMLEYGSAIPLFRENCGQLEERLSRKRFAELFGKSTKTILRFDLKMSGRTSKVPFLEKLGVTPLSHPAKVRIRRKVTSWVNYYPLLADTETAGQMQLMNLPFLIVHVFSMGKEDRVEWAGKLMALLTAVDLFMYQFYYGEGPMYWEKIKNGFERILLGKRNHEHVPRLNAYFSALGDLMEEARTMLSKEEELMICLLIKSYLEERQWKAGSQTATSSTDLFRLKSLRTQFSEGRLTLACLKIVHKELWASLGPHQKGMDQLLENAICLISISNEMMVENAVVFKHLPHNLVALESRINEISRKEVLERLWQSYGEIHAEMVHQKKVLMDQSHGTAKKQLMDFMRLVELQLAAWPEWYSKVLSRKVETKNYRSYGN
ncbi:hypothetical protein DN752_04315 [Echinicola strongylocentroti]|uniref:Cyclic nucleotide-binding domain-containing protein n=1 Tax=Echinicola strongylocentroti TaxID=1795355 RepID=A0A2Z4IF76_9BACT|nr:hypothetical protein [Echinicola strongylocentroti]AWW29429.1 hypothetical protein DN752_04315 [Echinicola strongylocentroti]